MKNKLAVGGITALVGAIFIWLAAQLFHPALLNPKGTVLKTDSYVIPKSLGKLISEIERINNRP